jgi:hypothetical protein
MTAGLYASAVMSHRGPLTDTPFTAKAASVPKAPVRFAVNPEPSLPSSSESSPSKFSPDFVISAANS